MTGRLIRWLTRSGALRRADEPRAGWRQLKRYEAEHAIPGTDGATRRRLAHEVPPPIGGYASGGRVEPGAIPLIGEPWDHETILRDGAPLTKGERDAIRPETPTTVHEPEELFPGGPYLWPDGLD